MSNWLITGGLGFIGKSLISRLLETQDTAPSITILDNESVGQLTDIDGLFPVVTAADDWPGSGEVKFLSGDIRDLDSVEKAVENADVIIHLAANTGVEPSMKDPRYDMMANIVGFFNVLEASQKQDKNQRIVFASSNAPLGAAKLPANEESPVKPLSPYGASKLAGEGYVSAFSSAFGMDCVALRFGNVYGPGSKHKGSVVAKFIKQGLSGETIEIYGDGNQTRDFIYITDLADAIICAGTRPDIAGELFQISPGTEVTIGELANAIKAGFEKRNMPFPDIQFGETRVGDMQKNYSKVDKAFNRLGWKAQTPIAEGLDNTLDWFLTGV